MHTHRGQTSSKLCWGQPLRGVRGSQERSPAHPGQSGSLAQHPEPLGVRGQPASLGRPSANTQVQGPGSPYVGCCHPQSGNALLHPVASPHFFTGLKTRGSLPGKSPGKTFLPPLFLYSFPQVLWRTQHIPFQSRPKTAPPQSLLSKGHCFKGHTRKMSLCNYFTCIMYTLDENTFSLFLSLSFEPKRTVNKRRVLGQKIENHI